MLIGNYGVGNFGDDVLKEYFLRTFDDIEWFVLSASPEKGEYARLPLGVRSFLRFDWIRTIKALKSCDAVVFGGGTLFADYESRLAPLLWGWHALWARLFHKNILLAFQGIGPCSTTVGRIVTRWICKTACHVSVRDELSYHRVMDLVKSKKVVQSFDPALCLFKRQKPDTSSKNVLIVIPRKNSKSMLADLVKNHLEDSEKIRLLSFQPDAVEERAIASVIETRYGRCEYKGVRSVQDLVDGFDGASFVISERFHGTLAALAFNVPFHVVTQREGDKHSALRRLSSDSLSRHCEDVISGEESLRSALRDI